MIIISSIMAGLVAQSVMPATDTLGHRDVLYVACLSQILLETVD